MIKNLFKLVLVVIFITACKVNNDGNTFISTGGLGKTITASGADQSKTYNLSFHTIEVSTGIEAEVIQSNVEKVVITAPQNILDKVAVESNQGDLRIHFQQGTRVRMHNSEKVMAKIYAKDLSAIKATSSADIVLKDQFTQEKMTIEANSSGSVSGDIAANNLEIKVSSSGSYKGKVWALQGNLNVSSSGDLIVSGEIKDLKAGSSSSGTISAKELIAENGQLSASSSGDLTVSISQKATASASSSGDVVIYKNGNPDIKKNESSSGSVEIK